MREVRMTQQLHSEVYAQEKRIFMQTLALSVPSSIIHNCPDYKRPRHWSAEVKPPGCVCGHSSRPAKARTAHFLLQELRFLLLFQVEYPLLIPPVIEDAAQGQRALLGPHGSAGLSNCPAPPQRPHEAKRETGGSGSESSDPRRTWQPVWLSR